MSMFLLDFEKPIAELESKLREMRELNATSAEVDLTDDIDRLEVRVEELRKSIYSNLTRWQRVQLARHPDRPYTLDYIEALTEGFLELHGDRHLADDPAVVGGFATLKSEQFGFRDQTVLVVGHQKGRDTKTRKRRRFGMPNPEGYRKAMRLMELAAKFGKPVITMLDTPGAYPGLEAEEHGQAEAIARNLLGMAKLPVPVVVVVIGEGASGGALGLGVGDRILMMENAWYSVISPESCSSILWRSWDYKEQAARALKLTAADLIETGIIDEIIPEPTGGAHRNLRQTFSTVGEAIARNLNDIKSIEPSELIDSRRKKFERMGSWSDGSRELNGKSVPADSANVGSNADQS